MISGFHARRSFLGINGANMCISISQSESGSAFEIIIGLSGVIYKVRNMANYGLGLADPFLCV